MDGHKTAQILLQAVQLDESAYKIGLSKVFFKADVVSDLILPFHIHISIPALTIGMNAPDGSFR
jgi:hypothetical protein